MSEDEIKGLLLNLTTVVESMHKRLTAMQLESSVTRIALMTALNTSADRAKVAQELRRMASRYEDLAVSTPLPDQDIAEYQQALLALAASLD